MSISAQETIYFAILLLVVKVYKWMNFKMNVKMAECQLTLFITIEKKPMTAQMKNIYEKLC